MASEMVVRVAKAMRRNRFDRTRRVSIFDETLPLSDNELDDARAAIEAMKTPTDEMINVGHDADYERFRGSTAISEIWDAMIDEALEEPASPAVPREGEET